ncbi:MAG: IS3 family transposase [Actinomycetia bacterium]|nr:IS3 family transposase [Actinomycetes bacterium]
MRRELGRYPVAIACRILGVSPSGYYAWLVRPPSDRELTDEWLLAKIKAAYVASHETYGAPRILHDLREEGIRVGKKRIARLMRQAGLQGVSRRRRWNTTRRDPQASPVADLVRRNFAAAGPDELWVSDIERHEALFYREEVQGLLRPVVAATGGKLRAA